MIRLDIKDKQFQRELKKFSKMSHKRFSDELFDATNAGAKLAKRKAPKDEGDLWQNIHPEITRKGMTGEIISEKDYSAAVEYGTKPHHIRIRNKKVLAGPKRKAPSGWGNISGEYAVYGKKVQHPGTEAQPFMLPAWKFAKKKLYEGLRKVFK